MKELEKIGRELPDKSIKEFKKEIEEAATEEIE